MRTAVFVIVAFSLLLCAGAEMGAQPGGKGGGGPGGGFGGGFGGKKKFGTDDGGPIMMPHSGFPVRVRWEYRTEISGMMAAEKLNTLGAEGWELIAIDHTGPTTRMYVFRRPGTGAPKADSKTTTDPAPEKKVELRNEIKMYALKNANAIELTQLIDEVLRVSKAPTMRVVAEPRTNQIIVNGPIEIHAQIIALLDRLDLPGENENPKGFKKKKN